MKSARSALALAATLVLLGTPVLAHHRETPPVVALTTSGDTALPRHTSQGNRTLALAVQSGPDKQIVTISPFRDPTMQNVIAPAGDHANPAISVSVGTVVFDSGSDPFGFLLPGRQVVAVNAGSGVSITSDPTGTSANPSVDPRGNRVAFESTADLAQTGTPGVQHVFLWGADGSIRRLSRGLGVSRNPILSLRRRRVVFESSSHPFTGADTGIAQVWLGDTRRDDAAPITAGLGPSTNATVSNDGRLVGFESTADLAGTQADTGTGQVYVYDTRSATYARITSEPAGCHLPSVAKVQRDWRIAYVCNGLPYFTMLRADQRYLVPTSGGNTQRVTAAFGIHFLLISTTANLLGSGTTPGHRVYLVNLYKRSPAPVAGNVTWFPSQGVPPL